MELKKVLIAISASVCILAFVVLVGFSIYNLYNTLAPSWGFVGGCGAGGCSAPYTSATCNKYADNYELTVNISNSNDEIKDIKCELASKGGMTADKDQVSLSLISPNSSDICDFVLKGEPTSAARVRVTYSKKGFWGYKNFSTIVDPYPNCSAEPAGGSTPGVY